MPLPLRPGHKLGAGEHEQHVGGAHQLGALGAGDDVPRRRRVELLVRAQALTGPDEQGAALSGQPLPEGDCLSVPHAGRLVEEPAQAEGDGRGARVPRQPLEDLRVRLVRPPAGQDLVHRARGGRAASAVQLQERLHHLQYRGVAVGGAHQRPQGARREDAPRREVLVERVLEVAEVRLGVQRLAGRPAAGEVRADVAAPVEYLVESPDLRGQHRQQPQVRRVPELQDDVLVALAHPLQDAVEEHRVGVPHLVGLLLGQVFQHARAGDHNGRALLRAAARQVLRRGRLPDADPDAVRRVLGQAERVEEKVVVWQAAAEDHHWQAAFREILAELLEELAEVPPTATAPADRQADH
mmetsp:Transcript_44664/g.120327  ORF Transcript_44664/g.120327 Transcript_44664/m.120327 type:complete len:354 (-) Transcript_44664:2102-3163(-)